MSSIIKKNICSLFISIISILISNSLEAEGIDNIRSLLSDKCVQMMSNDSYYGMKLRSGDSVVFGKASIVEQDGKLGIISKEGGIILEPQYDSITLDDDIGVRYIVEKSGKYGLIDFHGTILIDIEYDFLKSTRIDDFYIVKKDSKYGTIGINNQVSIPIIYDSIEVFKQGIYKVSLDSKFGLVDALGRIVIHLQYDDVDIYPRFNFVVKKDGKYGLFLGSNLILGSSHDHIYHLSEGYISFKKDGRVGLIYNGIIILDKRFDSISRLYKNIFLVYRNKKWGLVKHVNNEVVFILDTEYDQIELKKRSWNDCKYSVFEDDYHVMELETDDETIVVDRGFYEKDTVIFKKKDKYGLIKINYNEKEDDVFIDPIYDSIEVVDKYVVKTTFYSDPMEVDVPMSKYFIVKKDGVYSVLNEKGSIILTVEDQGMILHWGSLNKNLKRMCASYMEEKDLKKIKENEARGFIIVSQDKTIRVFVDEMK